MCCLKPYMIPDVMEAGCDEAGRGPLAGSVFAAAVVLDASKLYEDEPEMWERLNDSKKLTERQRYELRPFIESHALAWSVAEVTAEEIDRINILQASLLAMRRALDGLSVRPAHILVDGNKWRPYWTGCTREDYTMGVEIPATTVVKGDGTYLSIAAASILAKTYRDDYMRRLHTEYPQYGWGKNMGYPTPEHYEAIRKHGVTPYHRKSFNLKIEN